MAWISRISWKGGLRNKISQLISRRNVSGSEKPPKQVLTFKTTKVEVAENYLKPPRDLDWLGTFAGRKAMALWVGFGGAMTITFVSFGLNILFTTYVKEQYEERTPAGKTMTLQERITWDEAPEGKQLPEKIVGMFTKNQERAGIDDGNMDNIEVFMTYMLDPVVSGCSFTRQGGVVGVPVHQTWTSRDQVDIQNLKIKPTYNKWFHGYKIPTSTNPQDIETLKKSLVLSEEAIHFFLAQNLYIAGSWQAWIATFLPGSLWFFNYLNAININDKLHLFQKSRIIRSGMQGMLGFGTFIMFVGLKNILESFTRKNAIDHVVRTPKEAEAAVEFYTKTLERNLVLRKILGKDGEYYFQEDGELVGYGLEIPELTSMATYLKYSQEILAKRKSDESLK